MASYGTASRYVALPNSPTNSSKCSSVISIPFPCTLPTERSSCDHRGELFFAAVGRYLAALGVKAIVVRCRARDCWQVRRSNARRPFSRAPLGCAAEELGLR